MHVAPRVTDYAGYSTRLGDESFFYRRGRALSEAACRGARASGHAEAVAALQRAAALQPGDAVCRGNLAVALLRAGALQDAHAAAAHAVRAAPAGSRLLRANLRLVEDALDEQRAAGRGRTRVDELWCRDVADDALQRLTGGRFDTCTAAAAAAADSTAGPRTGGASGRPRTSRCPPVLARWCPSSCGRCLAELTSSLPPGWATSTGSAVEALDLGDRCDFPRVAASSITPEAFAREHHAGRRPVVVTGLLEGNGTWPILQWARAAVAGPEGLLAARQATSADGDGGDGGAGWTADGAAAAAFVRGALAAAVAAGRNEYVNLDRDPRDIGVREALQRSYTPPRPVPADLLRQHCLQDLPRRWALFSGSGTGSNYHVDPLNTSAWNALLVGRKRWALFPPTVGVPPGLREGETAPPGHRQDHFDAGNPYAREMGWWGVTAPWRANSTTPFEYFSRLPDTGPGPGRQVGSPPAPQQCMQRPGDVVFVPSGWWHVVMNVGPTVAVTENFAGDANVAEVLGELDKRPRVHPWAGDGPTAAAMCADALRAHLRDPAAASSDPGATGEATAAVFHVYTAGHAERLITAAGLHALFFTDCATDTGNMSVASPRWLAPRTWRGINVTAAAEAIDARRSAQGDDEVLHMVRVGCGVAEAAVRRAFDVSTAAAVRAASLQGTMFKYMPPVGWGHEADAEARPLADWLVAVRQGAAQPFLTEADRRLLLARMAAEGQWNGQHG